MKLRGILLLLALTGCPAPRDAVQPATSSTAPIQTLSLALGEGAKLNVGAQAPLNVSLRTDRPGSPLFSGMLADPSSANLTRWHAEPAEAVQFDAGKATATFRQAGPVRIWATWRGQDGRELRSNELALEIGG